MEETQKKDDMEKTNKKQEEYSVEITQVPAMSPPHDTSTPVEAIIVKNVPDTTPQNINPLTVEDLKKILNQSAQQTRLCENLVLFNVEEF